MSVYDDVEENDEHVFGSRPAGVLLYFIGDSNESIAALNGRFSDTVHGNKIGVLLRNLPYVDRSGEPVPEDKSLLRVTVRGIDTFTLYGEYEIVQLGDCARKFVIPAEILMQAESSEVELVTHKEWKEELEYAHTHAWNEYPPGEPIGTLTRLFYNKMDELSGYGAREST